MQIGLGVLQKTPNYLVVLEYLPLPQYLFPEEHLEVTYPVIIPKLNHPILVWRIGVGLGREHVQVLIHPVAAVGTIPMFPIDLNATQASFLAGAAVTQAHQASLIANNAADVALSSQLEVQHAQQVAKAIHAGAVQQQSDFAQAAAAYQQQATRAYLAQQEEARGCH